MQEDRNYFASKKGTSNLYTPTKGLKFSLRIDSIIKKSFERINMIFILKEKILCFLFRNLKLRTKYENRNLRKWNRGVKRVLVFKQRT